VRSNHTRGKKLVRPFSYALSIKSHTFHADLSTLSLLHIDLVFPSHLSAYLVVMDRRGLVGLG